jgi:hypothetical protein
VDDRSKVTVELDIFSGRPNPSWTLAAPERDEFLRQLSVPRQEGPPSRDLPGLGYRGFAVHVTRDGKSQDFNIRPGWIETGGQHFIDGDHAVEKYLIRTMPADLKLQFSTVLPDPGP